MAAISVLNLAVSEVGSVRQHLELVCSEDGPRISSPLKTTGKSISVESATGRGERSHLEDYEMRTG